MLIGKGPQVPEVEQALKPLVDKGLVILPGQSPQEEGPSYLAACDFYLSPHVPYPDGTRFFGSPTKLFEYMAMGKGIVASSLDQIGDLLKHEETALLTTPGDEQALIDAILRMTKDEALRHRLGAAARDEMLLNFSWDAHTNRIMQGLVDRPEFLLTSSSFFERANAAFATCDASLSACPPGSSSAS